MGEETADRAFLARQVDARWIDLNEIAAILTSLRVSRPLSGVTFTGFVRTSALAWSHADAPGDAVEYFGVLHHVNPRPPTS